MPAAKPKRTPNKSAPERGRGEPLDMQSEPEAVDAWLGTCRHPLKPVLEEVRRIILSAHREVGEHIKLNHPAFFYKGPLAPSAPKKFPRYLIVSNLHSKDGGVLLVVWQGGRLNDQTGFLTGDYPDGRRLVRIGSLAEAKKSAAPLKKLVRALVGRIAE